MKYARLFEEENQQIKERYELSMERIAAIVSEEAAAEPYRDFFAKTAAFILEMKELELLCAEGELRQLSEEKLKELNQRLYADILPRNYGSSYGNPSYAVKVLGEEYGRILSFLYTEIRGMIVYAFESRLFDMTIHNELFIQIYNMFEEENPSRKELKSTLYWFVSDYSDRTVAYRIREQLDPQLDFARQIIMESDLEDLRYLYFYGEYISENERKMAVHLNSLTDEEIDRIASVYTEGYRIGFEKAGIDLSKKKTVNIRYAAGFERVIRRSVELFAAMGLEPVIFRAAVNTINKKQHHKVGYLGAIPNKQFDYDHKGDAAIYLDSAFVKRKLDVLEKSYEEYSELAAVHAGPAVLETFGEVPFVPEAKKEAYQLNAKQQKLSVQYDNQAGQIVNRFIPGDERSFTIIAFPVQEIGEQFAEIFDEIVKVNTLDYQLYERIQQSIIDILDQGSEVHIKGSGANRTDLRVQLCPIKDPSKETVFENCVADVNIPVGEVFTTPVLKGTQGVLHVTRVYLNELEYRDLELRFTDGKVADYNCANFENEEENKRFIKENLLFHHDTLPLGEFAIGTNTTAYVMTEKYQIAQKMPILIAEKMGPHFAIGDTCYSWAEDNKVYNPDGKEIIARDNEISILRKEDISKAYFGCHTDITIPYDELGLLEVIKPDGTAVSIIENGRFVLEGTEKLNIPFENKE